MPEPEQDLERLIARSSLSLLGLLGAVGSCTSDLFCYFFDSIRTKMQMGGTQGVPKYASVRDCIYQTYRSNGIPGFFKGLHVGLLRQFPDAFLRIYTFEGLKRYFTKDSKEFPFPKHFVSGCFAGLNGCLIGNPLEIIKVRMINDIRREKYKGIVDCIIKTHHHNGLFWFTKGMTVNIPRAIIWNGVDLAAYEFYKKRIDGLGLSSEGSINHFISGALAGFSGTLVISPIEVVKTQYLNELKDIHRNPMECALDVYLKHGVRGFYLGFLPFTLTYTPWSFLFFASYEKYKQLLLPLVYSE